MLFDSMYQEKIAEMTVLKEKLEEGKNLNEMNGFSMKMNLLNDEFDKGS